MAQLDILEQNAQTISSELEAIKKLAETERAPKQTELKTQIDHIQDELQTHLHTLQSKTDAQSANERTKTEQLLTNMQSANDKLLQLGSEVQAATHTVPENEETPGVKGHRKKIWSKDERKNNATGNLARLGVVAGAVTGVTWLWNKVAGWFDGGKRSPQKTSRGQKLLKGIGIAGGSALAVAGGSKLRDKLQERLPDIFGPELSFKDSFTKVQADLNTISEQKLNINANLQYNEQTGEISSYGQTITIDIQEKTIPGMEVKFTSFDQLIHAANLANFCKSAFRGRCAHPQPFSQTKLGGDMQVDLIEGGNTEFMSGEGIPVGKILGGLIPAGLMLFTPAGKVVSKSIGIKGGLGAIAAGIAIGHVVGDNNSTLEQICPPIANGVGMQSFFGYLDRLDIRTQGGNKELENVTPSPLAEELKKLIVDVQKSDSNQEKFKEHGNARMMNAIPDTNNPEKYTFTSRGKTIIIFYNEQTKTIRIDGFNHTFTNVQEGLRAANLTNKLINENRGQCNSEQPFSYKGHVTGLLHPGLYIDNQWFDDRSLSESTFKKHFPTLYKQREKYVDYLNTMKGRKE